MIVPWFVHTCWVWHWPKYAGGGHSSTGGQ
jgi:hypothetical protein